MVWGLILAAATIFSESFSDETIWRSRWESQGEVKSVEDGRGGKCLSIGVREKLFTKVVLRPQERIAVKPGIPVQVRWEARTPDGDAPVFFRYDWFKADGSRISATQLRSIVEPTQPTMFMANERRLEPPAEAAFLGLMFHHAPMPMDMAPGLIANVRVQDLSEEIARRDARRSAVAAERAAAPGDRLLTYVSGDPGAAFPILPCGLDVPGRAGEILHLQECPGEHTRASVTLWTKTARSDVQIALRGNLPAKISAKIVKCHWQAEGAPAEVIVTGPGKTLVPEYLLNDGELVRVDEKNGTEELKLADGKGYLNALEFFTSRWAEDVPLSKVSISDAPEFLPFALPAERNRQLIVKFDIDPAAVAGDYSGELVFSSRGTELGTAPVKLTVLPFSLPTYPATVYDPSRKFTMGLYYWGQVNQGPEPAMSHFNKSREQMLNELALMREYSIDTPLLIWQPSIVNNEKSFRTNLKVARDSGLRDTLYLAGSGVIGNPQKPEDLAALKEKVVRLRKIAAEYGFHTVYFYGLDEAKGDLLLSQLPAWKTVREAGGKVIVSGYRGHFEKVGSELDLCVYADEPESAVPADWHRIGHRLFKYATPQSGSEDPNQYRRSYGLGLWKRGFDGASTYCFCGETFGWNDFEDSKRSHRKSGVKFRALNLGYLTRDGAVATLAMCGLDSAMKDVRYLSLLQRLLRERPNAEATKWFEAIDFASDPETVRRQAIEWILKLRLQPKVYRNVQIDDSRLPASAKTVARVLRVRLDERKIGASDSSAMTVCYRLDPSMSGEDAKIVVQGAKTEIVAGRLRGLVLATGKWLRKTSFSSEGLAPPSEGFDLKPVKEFRMAYLARHFLNYFMDAPVAKIVRYIEDLALDGNNAFYFQYLMPPVDAARADAAETAAFQKASEQMVAKVAELDCNFMVSGGGDQLREDSPEEWRGEPVKGRTNLGFNACPAKPAALKYILDRQRTNVKTMPKEGIGCFSYWPYDEGGCGCKTCWPWGGNGYLKMNEKLNAINKAAYPQSKALVSCWLFDDDDYDGLYEYLKTHDWIDYLLCDAHNDFPRYVLEHPLPKGVKLITFPEISMWGRFPWGGFGATALPRRFERLFRQVEHLASGYEYYSEGIFEDVNKIVVTGLYMDPQAEVDEILRGYARYYLAGVDPEDFVTLAYLLEDNHELPRATREKARVAKALVDRMDTKILPSLKTSWRWRLLYLRAQLDALIVGEKDRAPEAARAYFDELVTIYHAERERQAMWDCLSDGWTCPRYRPVGEKPNAHHDAILARRRAVYGNFAQVFVSSDPALAARVPAKGPDVPGMPGDELKVSACPGGEVRATVVLWSRNAYKDVAIELSDDLPAKVRMEPADLNLMPGMNHARVVTLSVAPDARLGTLRGRIRFRSHGAKIGEAPVMLEVK